MRLGMIFGILIGLLPSQTIAHEHECGKGPHIIEVKTPILCPCKDIKPQLQKDGSYLPATKECPEEKECSDVQSEEWTDWPECEDSRRVDISYGLNGSTFEWEPLSAVTLNTGTGISVSNDLSSVVDVHYPIVIEPQK